MAAVCADIRRSRPRGQTRGMVWGLALGLGCGLWSGSADATVVEALTLDAKVNRSEAVIHGVVESVVCRRRDGSGPIETEVAIRIVEAFRGSVSPGDVFALVRAGGTVGGVTEWIPGLHRYREGDEVVILAEAHRRGWVALGVGIGTYVIERPEGCPVGARGCGRVRFDPEVSQRTPEGTIEASSGLDAAWPRFRAQLEALTSGAPRVDPEPSVSPGLSPR